MSVLQNPIESKQLTLAGKKVYSARSIGIYAAVVNTPLGCILYGINLCARGTKITGRIMLTIGIVGEIGLFLAVLINRSPSARPMYLIGILAAICLYQFEKKPVKAALQQGATLARWWPPALFVLLANGVLLGLIVLIG